MLRIRTPAPRSRRSSARGSCVSCPVRKLLSVKTHAVDLASLGAAPDGGDCLYEIKNPAPISSCAKGGFKKGVGSKEHGGSIGTYGHMFGLGNVEEQYRAMVLGVEGRGRQGDGPLDHWTGKGWVKPKVGQYTPALRRRKFVLPVIVERGFSGKDNHTKRHIRKLGDMAVGAGATDRTAYGRHRGSTRSFVTHHTQQISKACIVAGARRLS